MRLAGLIVSATLLWAAPAFAEPQIEIKARMRLTVDRVERTPQGSLLISGRLVDESVDEGLFGASVGLSLSRKLDEGRYVNVLEYAEQTRDDGSFTLRVPHIS